MMEIKAEMTVANDVDVPFQDLLESYHDCTLPIVLFALQYINS